MAIKFSVKDQPVAPAVAKPVKSAAAPKSGEVAEAATDLFKSSTEAPPRKAGKKK